MIQLERKLTAINAYIDTMCLESNATMNYLKQYKAYVNELIMSPHKDKGGVYEL